MSETSQIIGQKRRTKKEKFSATTSQASHIQREKIKQRRNKARGFFDEEAELGSDDEEKDDVKKQINKEDIEENEDGLDSSLDGFVEKGDGEVIGEAEDDALIKF